MIEGAYERGRDRTIEETGLLGLPAGLPFTAEEALGSALGSDGEEPVIAELWGDGPRFLLLLREESSKLVTNRPERLFGGTISTRQAPEADGRLSRSDLPLRSCCKGEVICKGDWWRA